MNKNLHRQTRIFCPPDIPYDQDWDETILGNIIKPMIQQPHIYEMEGFWFSRYNCPAEADSGDCNIEDIPDSFKDPETGHYRSIRFRYSINANEVNEFEVELEKLIVSNQCKTSDFRDYGFLQDLGSDRHVGTAVVNRVGRHYRAFLVSQLYHLISKLVIDTIVGPDEHGRFTQEHNESSQNPHGSTFESLHHLFCNITNVPTSVLMGMNDKHEIVTGTHWNTPPCENLTRIPVKF